MPVLTLIWNFARFCVTSLVARLPRNLLRPRNLLVFAHDVAMSYIAFIGAFVGTYYLRAGHVPADSGMYPMAFTFASVAAVVYLFTGLYRHVWEYVSARDAFNVIRTTLLTVLLFLLASFFVTRLDGFPRTALALSAILLVTLLGGPRLLVRLVKDHQLLSRGRGASNILLVGAGPEAEQFVRAVARDPSSPYTVVGMVTINPTRVGQVIQGVEVLGHDDQIAEVLAHLEARDLKVDKLVVVRREISGAQMQRLLALAEKADCKLERLTPPTVSAYGDSDLKPRPIAIEDLLGRPQLNLDRPAMTAMIEGRRILITGAGGSIGAELVRQISDSRPAAIYLLDNNEYALYSVDLEMRMNRPNVAVTALLADVRDPPRLSEIFAATKPDLVFHAAALKHVPILERNALDGLLTNAIGTRNVADACVAASVPAMVLISTDKAVNPSSVMGASKRIAEMYCQALDLRRAGTRFITVRFGNVLGSAGSVVPLFQKQLEAGGPLTVTHPDIARYFMTVREAVELVLQAAAVGRARGDEGAIYVLDMGQPIKIIDLARQMIRLAGKVPEVDVRISVVGLRPGEKLYEELFHGEEPPVATDQEGVLIARPRTSDHALLAGRLTGLGDACRRRDEAAAIALLHDLVPELKRAQAPAAPTLRLVK